MSKRIFLLGGNDLEMTTIKNLLVNAGEQFETHDLRWDNAKLSSYEKTLEEYGNSPDYQIYGIELNEDIPHPDNYVRIDHHNDFANKPSSLEQVAKLLDLAMDRHMQLVAANDSRYIPGMIKLGASREEIDDIRRADRAAQGVSEDEDERLAEESLKSCKGDASNLYVVKSLTSKFSAICDRMYPYRRLLIYNDDVAEFYGEGVNDLTSLFKSELDAKKMYHGGGDSGYLGTVSGAYSKEEIAGIVDKIRTHFMYSYHIFYFPFKWAKKEVPEGTMTQLTDFSQIRFLNNGKWVRPAVAESQENDGNKTDKNNVSLDAQVLYNEKNYYFRFVHDVLYDSGDGNDNLVMHFERKEPQEKDVRYLIKVSGREKPYSLKVDAININLYKTGVGLMSFYLRNDDESQCDTRDILNINQYGRRILPPFWSEVNAEKRQELSEYLEISGLDTEISKEDFKSYTVDEPWTATSMLDSLLKDLTDNLTLTPVIDDRMFVLSLYKNDDMSRLSLSAADAYCNPSSPFSEFWYKYLFVDTGWPTCQNDEMMRDLLRSHTYLRWQKWNSLYGVSRYSFVYLTNSGVPSYLVDYFMTTYARMMEIALVQRASVLCFSNEVTTLTKRRNWTLEKLSESVDSLNEEYIRFINRMYFNELTSQDQGVELYGLIRQNLDIDSYVEELKDEIEKLHDTISFKVERSRNEKAETLNFMAAILLPVSIVTGFWSMNMSVFCNVKSNWLSFAIAVGLMILGVAFSIFLVRRRPLKNKRRGK